MSDAAAAISLHLKPATLLKCKSALNSDKQMLFT